MLGSIPAFLATLVATATPTPDAVHCLEPRERYCVGVFSRQSRVCVIRSADRHAEWCIVPHTRINQRFVRRGAIALSSPDGDMLFVGALATKYRPNRYVLFAYRRGSLIWKLRMKDVAKESDAPFDEGHIVWASGMGFGNEGNLVVMTGSLLMREFSKETGKFVREWKMRQSEQEK